METEYQLLEQSTTITKSMLDKIHRSQLKDGHSNNAQKDEIINSLGGIDEILSNLLGSNANINQKQLQSLHHILCIPHHQQQTTSIKRTSTNIEDRVHGQRITFEFSNDDILLFSLCSEKTATNITKIINDKFTKIALSVILFILIALGMLNLLNILSSSIYSIYYGYFSFYLLIFSIYCFFWILYLNKKAMNLLLKGFTFWFKIFYLIQFLVAKSIVLYIGNRQIHFIFADFLFDAAFLFLVMIFDAVNIKQSNKIIISSLALGSFAYYTLYLSHIAFYRDEFELYHQSTFQLPDMFGVGSMKINIIDITVNSAQILAIFLLKQMVSTIRKPKQASVIITKPFIVYQNQKQNIPTIKTLRHWKRATVLFWIVWLLFVGAKAFLQIFGTNLGSNLLAISWLVLTFLIIFLFSMKNIKLLVVANILIFISLILYCVGIFLFKWIIDLIFLLFLGFGVSATYTLKVSKFEESASKTHETLNSDKEEKSENDGKVEEEKNEIEIGNVCVQQSS